MRTPGSVLLRWAAAGIVVIPLTVLALIGSASLLGCAATSPFTVQRRPDGNYKLSCREPLPRCLQRAEDICLGTRYVVIRAVDHHDYVGTQSSVGEAQVRSSEALFRCGNRGKSWSGPEADPMALADPVAATAEAPPPTRICVPGATQPCTGPGACRGGQACVTNGSGFSACDCGVTPSGVADGPAPAAKSADTAVQAGPGRP